ncbi:hypothetical protein ACFQO7_21720 [Catellatospora aurea]|uniref:Transposase IS200 family protein n=1 Tax=Catellatospora aurea TaxID=1337874 RepID=A0ABW2GZX3_9ACTN
MSATRMVRRFSGGVYDLGGHIVWCPKYRRAVLGGRVMQTVHQHIDTRRERPWRKAKQDGP